MDHSPPESSVHGILQARILEWVAMPSSRGSSPPRDRTRVSYVSCIGRWVLYHQCHLGSPVVLTQNKVGDVSGILCTSTAGGMGLIPGWGTNLPPMQETQVQCLGQEDPLEMGMATPSSILAVNQNLGLSCLENYMDRGAWQTTVHGVSKIQKQLSN